MSQNQDDDTQATTIEGKLKQKREKFREGREKKAEKKAAMKKKQEVQSESDTVFKNVNKDDLDNWYKDWVVREVQDKTVQKKKKKKALFFRRHKEADQETSKREATNLLQKKAFGDIWTLLEVYCKDWEHKILDLATFCFYLAAFNKPQFHDCKVVVDKKIMLDGYHWVQYAFAAYKEGRKLVLTRVPFLKKDNFITGDWSDEINQSPSPAWFCAIDHNESAVVLALRGTKNKRDIMIDLAAQFVKWRKGYAHGGFVQSLIDLEPRVRPIIVEQMELHPTYKLRIVGHSLGAAVAALLVLKWAEDFPEWDVFGYGFATPCCMSNHLLEESQKYFITFVHNFDAVSRLSVGSIQDIHNGMRVFIKEVGNHLTVLAHVMHKIATDSSNEKVRRIMQGIDDIIKQNLHMEITEGTVIAHLFPPGVTYQLWRQPNSNRFPSWKLYESTGVDYARLMFSPTMLADHGTQGYVNAFENILAVTVLERKVWLSMTPSRRIRIHDYWEVFRENNPFSEKYDIDVALSFMRRSSEWKLKAYELGLIRPFLLLVSMSPKQRVAVAVLMGLDITQFDWYYELDAHYEAYFLLTHGRRSAQQRGNRLIRTANPLAHNSNWYQIVKRSAKHICSEQVSHIRKNTRKRIRRIKHYSYETSLELCKLPSNPTVAVLEETAMLLFYELSHQCILRRLLHPEDSDSSSEDEDHHNHKLEESEEEEEEEEEDDDEDDDVTETDSSQIRTLSECTSAFNSASSLFGEEDMIGTSAMDMNGDDDDGDGNGDRHGSGQNNQVVLYRKNRRRQLKDSCQQIANEESYINWGPAERPKSETIMFFDYDLFKPGRLSLSIDKINAYNADDGDDDNNNNNSNNNNNNNDSDGDSNPPSYSRSASDASDSIASARVSNKDNDSENDDEEEDDDDDDLEDSENVKSDNDDEEDLDEEESDEDDNDQDDKANAGQNGGHKNNEHAKKHKTTNDGGDDSTSNASAEDEKENSDDGDDDTKSVPITNNRSKERLERKKKERKEYENA